MVVRDVVVVFVDGIKLSRLFLGGGVQRHRTRQVTRFINFVKKFQTSMQISM